MLTAAGVYISKTISACVSLTLRCTVLFWSHTISSIMIVRGGKKLGHYQLLIQNWYLAAAFRTSALFCQRFCTFWCCIHLTSCSIATVCLVCPQAVCAPSIWKPVYSECIDYSSSARSLLSSADVLKKETCFSRIFKSKQHFTHEWCFYLHSGRFFIQTCEEMHDNTVLRSASEDVRNVSKCWHGTCEEKSRYKLSLRVSF